METKLNNFYCSICKQEATFRPGEVTVGAYTGLVRVKCSSCGRIAYFLEVEGKEVAE